MPALDSVDLDTLRKAADDARGRHFRLTRLRDDEHRELLNAAGEKIRADLEAKYGEQITEALRAERAADVALKTALIADATRRLADMPQGMLVKWDWRTSGGPKCPVARGRLEVCTFDSQFPINKTWSTPHPGQIFIRLLNKTGEPGLRFERLYYGDSIPSNWLPEGETPKDGAA